MCRLCFPLFRSINRHISKDILIKGRGRRSAETANYFVGVSARPFSFSYKNKELQWKVNVRHYTFFDCLEYEFQHFHHKIHYILKVYPYTVSVYWYLHCQDAPIDYKNVVFFNVLTIEIHNLNCERCSSIFCIWGSLDEKNIENLSLWSNMVEGKAMQEVIKFTIL